MHLGRSSRTRGLLLSLSLGLGLSLATLGSCQQDPAGDECEAPEVLCDDQCVDPSSSMDHCGGCDHPCMYIMGMVVQCIDSTCEYTCDDDHLDCNDALWDGCEVAGTTCPAEAETDCDDGLDDDGDGDTDCDDADCDAAPACAAACPTFDLGSASGDAVATGTNSGCGDDYPSTPGCGDVSSSGEDVTFSWMPFTSGCFRIDTEASSFDTVLRVYDTCSGGLQRCDDDGGADTTSRLNLEAGAGVTYIIVIDGHAAGDASGYELDINYLGPACP